MLAASTATHPSAAYAILCLVFGFFILRFLFKCVTGKYDNPPQRVIEKTGQRF